MLNFSQDSNQDTNQDNLDEWGDEIDPVAKMEEEKRQLEIQKFEAEKAIELKRLNDEHRIWLETIKSKPALSLEEMHKRDLLIRDKQKELEQARKVVQAKQMSNEDASHANVLNNYYAKPFVNSNNVTVPEKEENFHMGSKEFAKRQAQLKFGNKADDIEYTPVQDNSSPQEEFEPMKKGSIKAPAKKSVTPQKQLSDAQIESAMTMSKNLSDEQIKKLIAEFKSLYEEYKVNNPSKLDFDSDTDLGWDEESADLDTQDFKLIKDAPEDELTIVVFPEEAQTQLKIETEIEKYFDKYSEAQSKQLPENAKVDYIQLFQAVFGDEFYPNDSMIKDFNQYYAYFLNELDDSAKVMFRDLFWKIGADLSNEDATQKRDIQEYMRNELLKRVSLSLGVKCESLKNMYDHMLLYIKYLNQTQQKDNEKQSEDYFKLYQAIFRQEMPNEESMAGFNIFFDNFFGKDKNDADKDSVRRLFWKVDTANSELANVTRQCHVINSQSYLELIIKDPRQACESLKNTVDSLRSVFFNGRMEINLDKKTINKDGKNVPVEIIILDDKEKTDTFLISYGTQSCNLANEKENVTPNATIESKDRIKRNI